MENTNGHSVQNVKLGWTRCYLLKCTEGYLLVDVYYPGYYAEFEKKLGKKGIGVSEIKYLFLTHHHDDHAGFAAEMVQQTGCRVIAHRNALSALEKGESEDSGGKMFNRRLELVFKFYMLSHKEFKFPPLRLIESDIVIDGDNDEFLKGIGIDGVILHTPGHTKDSISILLSDGSAFVGDAAMNFLRWTGVVHEPIYIEDMKTVHESWAKLREQGAKIIYPSHGKCFSASELE